VLFAGAFCEGVGRSLFSGTDKALLYETLQEQKQSSQFESIFGKISSVEQIALGLSAVIGGFLALISLQFVMWISVIPALLSFICAFYFVNVKRESRGQQSAYVMLKEAFKGLVSNRRLRLVSMAEILGFGFGEATFHFQAAFFNLLIPQWLIGVVRGINHLCGAIGFWTACRIIKRFGYKRLLIGGNTITSLIRLLVIVIPSVVSPFVMAILNVDYGYSSTAKHGLMQREFSDQQRSTMGLIVPLTGSLIFSIISVLLGYIADISTPIHAMLFGLSSNVVIIWIYMTLFTGKNPLDNTAH
jgi:MFS family permease